MAILSVDYSSLISAILALPQSFALIIFLIHIHYFLIPSLLSLLACFYRTLVFIYLAMSHYLILPPLDVRTYLKGQDKQPVCPFSFSTYSLCSIDLSITIYLIKHEAL